MFKPFDITFTPPDTVPKPTPEVVPTLVQGPVVGGTTSGAQSRAGELIAKLNDLTAMSRYLQQAIVARTGRTAIEINPAVDPNIARALSSIYSTSTPPIFITIEMYDQLLDAHLGALQLEMALGNDTTIQANPLQVGDLMTAVDTVSGHLMDSPSYNNWLPLQLSSLKVDAIVFQSWVDSLSTYPAYYKTVDAVPSIFSPNLIAAAQLDVSNDLFAYQSAATDSFGQAYATIYKAMATPSVIVQDASAIINEYFNQPVQNLMRISALFNAMIGLNFKSAIGELQGDITNYVFARLASEVSGMLGQCDQLVSLAVKPLQGTLGSLGSVISAVQKQAANIGTTVGNISTGMSKANLCAQSNPYNKVSGATSGVFVDGLGVVSGGLKHLSESIDWAQRKVADSLATVDLSFRQLMERRLKSQGDRNELMCLMKCMDGMVQLTDSVVAAFQQGSVTPSSSPQQKQEVADRILNSLRTSSVDIFISTDSSGSDQITENSSDMPQSPPPVQRVLERAGFSPAFGTLKV